MHEGHQAMEAGKQELIGTFLVEGATQGMLGRPNRRSGQPLTSCSSDRVGGPSIIPSNMGSLHCIHMMASNTLVPLFGSLKTC